MKAAIMQPYLMPYIGYFQLINSVDVFVVYDDVNFIKKGWVNRNNILVNGKAHLFSAALKDASQNKRINEIELDTVWKKDFLKTISLSYKKAPFFETVFPVLENIINHEEKNLARFITNSLREICHYLSIETKILVSSEIEKDNNLKGSDKIIEICKRIGARQYTNAIGGMELYDAKTFENDGIWLHFIKSKPIVYAQFKNEFIPWLSIIDVMLFNSPSEIKKMLDQYELL
ncbi:MAG TPA: WbqC family protein [Flavobacterium sp.]|nr:WbqC family protein [Flavobacterium sp.]